MTTDQKPPSIKILSGALDELPNHDIVMRGVVAREHLSLLRVDGYQRETLSNAKVKKLADALAKGGQVPDITLGMRGEDFIERNGIFYLRNPVYIVDGLQRQTAALRAMAANPELVPHLGALLHFNTNPEIERKMFEDLNLGHTPLSGSVHLRNQRTTNPAVAVLYQLSEENKSFPLHGRVSWKQNMGRGDLINGTTYAKIVGSLLSHAGPGRNSQVLELASGLQKIMEVMGRNVFIDSIIRFFEVVDGAWGFDRITYRETASYVKANFLVQYARVFSDHTNFWDKDGCLKVDRAAIAKWSQFPVMDPTVVQLASGTGMSGEILYDQLVRHYNSHRRTGHLVVRKSLEVKGRRRSGRNAADEEDAG